MQVDESILSNPQFQQLATELTTTNNPNNPPTNTTNTTNSPTDKTSNTLINWSNDLINSETTEATEYNVDKNKVNEEMEDYRRRYLNPATNSEQDYVNLLREIRKTYDITDNVPQKEQDQRLSGLLMLANAFGNLASVTGEAAGDSAGGNRGLVPVRTNDKFDNLYNQYLANKDAAAQARALQIKRNMDDALEELKIRYDADKDYRDKEEREYQRLIDKYSNKKITKTGFNRVQKDPNSQEYKDYLEKKRLDKIRAYRSGGGSRKKKEDYYAIRPAISADRIEKAYQNNIYDEKSHPITTDVLRGFQDTQDGINRLYAELKANDFFKNYSEWEEAKDVFDKAAQINKLLEYIYKNNTKEAARLYNIYFEALQRTN